MSGIRSEGTGVDRDLVSEESALPPADEADLATARQPDWWHRDHPIFTAISGFFSGLVFATVVPGLFFAVLRGLTDERTAEEAFPFVLLFLVVPIALLTFPRTRRFGQYLLVGIVVALLVIFGVGTFVFWLMMTYSS